MSEGSPGPGFLGRNSMRYLVAAGRGCLESEEKLIFAKFLCYHIFHDKCCLRKDGVLWMKFGERGSNH
jgi:hypothetical protein